MDNIRVKYQVFVISTLLIMCMVISIVYICNIKSIGYIYEESAQESIILVKKDFLKDNVNNVIAEIELYKNRIEEKYERLIEESLSIMDNYDETLPNQFVELATKYFAAEDKNTILSVIIMNNKTNQSIYERIWHSAEGKHNPIQQIELMKKNSSAYRIEEYGDYTIAIGVDRKQVDQLVKDYVYEDMHNMKFANNAYMWLSEVVNYQGGDDYAIRRIHPNLVYSEGDFLSTNTKDIMGNTPYAEELKGINQNGEVFLTYYFKKKDSDIIAEKISFSKLYKQYNWIISMGIYQDDVQDYVDRLARDRDKSIDKMINSLTTLVFFLFAISMIGFYVMEKWYHRNSNKLLKEQVNTDSLTQIYNRRAAENYLKLAFKEFKSKRTNWAIIMIDIDDFKKINDTYGHDVGDQVLINIVETLTRHTRGNDKLCRWGGEEFLLIGNGIRRDGALSFANKLIDQVSKIGYKDGEKEYYATISMGVSFFEVYDTDYKSAVKRADIGLYKAKDAGKNRAIIEMDN